jgi:hypothetical protein
MHPRRRLLQAFVDHELPAEQAERLRGHTATCARCAARIDRIRSLTGQLHAAVLDFDALAPAAWQSDVAQQREVRRIAASSHTPSSHVERTRVDAAVAALEPAAHAGEPSQRTTPAGRRHGVSVRAPLRWAAIFVFGSAAVAAAALFVRRVVLPETVETTTVDAVTRAPPAQPQLNVAGAVRVQPVGGAVTITITDAGEGSQLFVEFGDATGVGVQIEGAVAPHFVPRDGAVDVALAGAQANVRVSVPASLRTAVVQSGDRVLVRITDGRIEPPGAAAGVRIR